MTEVPAPTWIAASLKMNEGRDPLGLQTTTQDRLMPLLLPGILELSRRARYFSFHAFLLAEYQERRLKADSKSLSAFIKRREWEFGLAVQRCPRRCGSSPVGARRLGVIGDGVGPFPRGESVESPFGGYGLYYRSPLADFGLVARSGTLLGDEPIPVDVLRDTPRARRLAETFREAVRNTAYYRHFMQTSDDLPASVIEEYAEAACLCRLRELPQERVAVHDAMFGTDDLSSETDEAAAAQRRRSVGHYLTLVGAKPEITVSEPAYREALWSPPAPRNESHALVAGQWAALTAKDVWQEALCSVWSDFCQAGLARTRDLGRGLTWEETRSLAGSLTSGPPAIDASMSTAQLSADLASGAFTATDDGSLVNVAEQTLEELRQLAVRLDSASFGLIVLLELARRTESRSGTGWAQAASVRSGWQPSLATVVESLRAHLAGAPTVAETLWWLVSRFVVPVHERIAYSKLPEFTFRFRWEDGLLRFYDLGVGRFSLAAIRWGTLGWLTWDLGLWDQIDDDRRPAELTSPGSDFAREAFS